jgi:hypothetical protein
VVKSLIQDRCLPPLNFVIFSSIAKYLRPMHSQLSQTSWATRGHISLVSDRLPLFYALELITAANLLRFSARKTPGCKVHKIGRLHKIQPFEASVNIQLTPTMPRAWQTQFFDRSAIQELKYQVTSPQQGGGRREQFMAASLT